jgi:hypothetical protein
MREPHSSQVSLIMAGPNAGRPRDGPGEISNKVEVEEYNVGIDGAALVSMLLCQYVFYGHFERV